VHSWEGKIPIASPSLYQSYNSMWPQPPLNEPYRGCDLWNWKYLLFELNWVEATAFYLNCTRMNAVSVNQYEPLCGCGRVFFKMQLQLFGYKIKQYIIYWVSFFSALKIQYLQSKNCLLFFTVQVIALFNEQCN